MSPVILYSTDGCHLCELAQQQLEQLAHSFEIVDIIDDASLVEKYGTRIPVVLNNNTQELGWPFELSELKTFLGSSC